jgi:TolB-like protein/cytochrome c-type biogenesis protein CcmH/NrfG
VSTSDSARDPAAAGAGTDWRRVEQLFHEALERPPDQRRAFLAQACDGDSALQHEVESLLAQEEGSLLRDGVQMLARQMTGASREGTRLGPYVLGPLIGEGGMGEVYRARDARLDREVAIKLLPANLAHDPDRLRRAEREARVLASLSHPNIAAIFGLEEGDGLTGLVLELVPGLTLHQHIATHGPLEFDEALAIARQIASALDAAHQHGIVHRDLKPANITITPEGLVKVLDFGLARIEATGPDGSEMAVPVTGQGAILGTPAYMSPEQARGKVADRRTDIWAFGVVLFEMLTGQRVFQGDSVADTLAAVIHADPRLDRLPPSTPRYVRATIDRCLQKDARDRARDISDVRMALDGGFGGPAPTATAPRSRAARVRLAVAVVLVLAIAAAAGWLLRRDPDVPIQQSAAEPDRPLIAVRPFRNLSADSQQGYFAAGMTEEIRGQLSQVAALRILSGSGLDGYADDLPRAARELGLRSYVDGSVRVEGSRVRVSAELVDARTRESLWRQQYERELAGVLAVQSDIAQQIARALKPNLSEAQRARLAKQPTDNIEAYTLFLRARELTSVDRRQNLEAIELLKQALALDPKFAEAQARAAYRLVFMGYYDDPSWIDKGIAEAEAALRIDPGLPSAHFTLGTAYAMKGQGARSRQAFLRALELNPSGAGLLSNFSLAEMQYGRLDEAVYLGRRGFMLSGRRGFYHLVLPILFIRADAESRILLEEAERRDPTVARVQMMLGVLEVFEGRGDKALVRSKAIAEREPKNMEMSLHRADIAYVTDQPDLESLLAPLVERSPTNRLLWDGESVRLRFAYALHKRGESARSKALAAEAERYARERIAAGDDTPAHRVELAAAAALRGEADAAVEWLERAFEAGYRDYGFLERDPIFRPLGRDARFVRVLDRMRRDVEAQRERARTRGLLELKSLIGPEPQP